MAVVPRIVASQAVRRAAHALWEMKKKKRYGFFKRDILRVETCVEDLSTQVWK